MDTLVQVGRATSSQTATTLSRGEAQRVKLASELSKGDTGQTLYGLHFHDIQHLLKVLVELRERGNTVVVIEHNLDVIRNADRIIDLGPKRRRGGWEDRRFRDT